MGKKSMLSDVVGKCFHIGKIIYDVEKYGWNWISNQEIPSKKGIYFLVSQEGIEKVGSARGKKGLKGRLSQYILKYDSLKNDPTNKKWHSVMSSELKNIALDVYCMSIDDFDHEINTPLGSVSVKTCCVLEIESFFFYKAKKEMQPMRLCGNSP